MAIGEPAMPARGGGDPLVAGLDLGTQAVRALIFTPEGGLVASAQRPTPIETLGPGAAAFDPEALWAATVSALGEAVGRLDRPARVRGVACASFAESGIDLDAEGRPLGPAQAWYDTRPAAQTAELDRRFGASTLALKSGMRMDPVPGLAKLLYLRDTEPARFARIRHLLCVADFIAYRLSGTLASDESLAARSLLLDLTRGTWNSALCAALDLCPSLLPPLADNGAALGSVTPAAAAATGLPPDCTVAVGGHDHVLGALATGALAPRAGLDSIGTAEALLRALPRPLTDPRVAAWGFEQGQVRLKGTPRAYLLGGLTTGAGAIEWVRGVLAGDTGYDSLIAAAATVPPGSGGAVFVPHLRAGSPPDVAARAAGGFLGLSTASGPAALFRAVLEGLAFDLRKVAEHMESLATGDDGPAAPPLDRLLVSGGGTRNRLLVAIKAAVYGRPLDVVELPESTSSGAAVLAALGAGLHADVESALAAVAPPIQRVVPDAKSRAAYDGLYRESYLPALDALRRFGAARPGPKGARNI